MTNGVVVKVMMVDVASACDTATLAFGRYSIVVSWYSPGANGKPALMFCASVVLGVMLTTVPYTLVDCTLLPAAGPVSTSDQFAPVSWLCPTMVKLMALKSDVLYSVTKRGAGMT